MSSCTVTVQAQAATPGVYSVTVNPGNLITNRGTNANTSGATLTVTAAPTGPAKPLVPPGPPSKLGNENPPPPAAL